MIYPTIYRQTRLGEKLKESLDEMGKNNDIDEDSKK